MVALKNAEVHVYKDKYLVNVLKCDVCIYQKQEILLISHVVTVY